MDLDDRIRQVRSALSTADSVVFFTGAGMSAESGVPTFRGPQGLWRGSRPEELATPEAFQSDPQRVTDWYRMRRRLVASVEPHAGHRALAEFCLRHSNARVVTQNVDGLHTRAGCAGVEELHGTLWIDRCERCAEETALSALDPIPAEGEPLRRCTCGGAFRPGVVWFGESLPAATWDRSVGILRSAEVVIVVGTSSVVQPAASMVDLAPRDALRVEVNPEPSRSDLFTLAGTAADLLPQILRPA